MSETNIVDVQLFFVCEVMYFKIGNSTESM